MYEFLLKYASSHTIKELVILIKEKLGIDIDNKKLAQYCIGKKIKYKYEKPNKAHSNKPTPIGTIVKKTDGGYLKIKTGNHKWEYLQRYLYQKENKVKLKEDEYVIFLNQNRRDFRMNNLKVINRSESGLLSNYGSNWYSTEPEITKLCILNVKLNKKIKEYKYE